MLDLRLVIPALAAWGGAAVMTALPQAVGWLDAALWCTAIASAGAAVGLRVNRGRHGEPDDPARLRGTTAAVAVCLAATAVALVGAAVGAALPARHPHALDGLDGHAVVVRAAVEAPAQDAATTGFGASRVRFAATVTTVTAGGQRLTGSMPAQIYAPAGTTVTLGEMVEMRGSLQVQPGASSTVLRLYASGDLTRVARPTALLGVAGDMRAAFSRVSARLPGDGGVLLPGLAIGDVHALPPSLTDAMKQASLTHLTAVSGANCAVVVALVGTAVGACGGSRGARTAASLSALGGFVVLVTPQPSVLRAAVMATVIVVGGWAGRPARAVPALALAVIGLLVIDPWLARDYGFILSVLATGALLLVSPPLAQRWSRWLPGRLAAVLAVPVAAQLVCQPVLLLLTPTLPLYGVPANLVAEPAAPIATVLGLVACLLAPWWPAAAGLIVHLAWLPSAWIAAVARVAASLPLHSIEGLAGGIGIAAVCLATAAVLALVVRPSRRSSRLARLVIVGASCLLVGCLAVAGAGARVGETLVRPTDWTIAACDIGQGDAVLVRSKGVVALVDVGPDPATLARCLASLRVGRIDLLILTHYDHDHVGGLAAVEGRVGTALVGPADDARGGAMADGLARGGAAVHVATVGDGGHLGDASWRVLWPDSENPGGMTPGNERSVTVVFEGDGLRSLFLGDLDERAQTALLDTGRVPRVNVVKMAHHGSADQAEALYRAAAARLALISCGAGNDYGHPTATALGILAHTGTRVMRTDLQGILLVASDGRGGLRTWSQRSASEGSLFTPARRGETPPP
jgi:competence protein ComEC